MTTSLLPRTLLRTWPTTSSSGEDQNFSFSIISSPQFSLISWLCKFRSHYCIKYQTNEIMSKGCIFPWSFIKLIQHNTRLYGLKHVCYSSPQHNASHSWHKSHLKWILMRKLISGLFSWFQPSPGRRSRWASPPCSTWPCSSWPSCRSSCQINF